MKKNILFLLFLVFFVACETGTRYDKNATTKKTLEEVKSGLVDRNIEALLEDEDDIERRETFDNDLHPIIVEDDEIMVHSSSDSFDKEYVSNNPLDVKNIREGHHEDYLRLVFDIYSSNGAAKNVGSYKAQYNKDKKDIVVVLTGYRKFSAPLPSFSIDSPIEQIYFEKYRDKSAYKFHIKLRGDSKVRIFDLQNPARLVFDIKPI